MSNYINHGIILANLRTITCKRILQQSDQNWNNPLTRYLRYPNSLGLMKCWPHLHSVLEYSFVEQHVPRNHQSYSIPQFADLYCSQKGHHFFIRSKDEYSGFWFERGCQKPNDSVKLDRDIFSLFCRHIVYVFPTLGLRCRDKSYEVLSRL